MKIEKLRKLSSYDTESLNITLIHEKLNELVDFCNNLQPREEEEICAHAGRSVCTKCVNRRLGEMSENLEESKEECKHYFSAISAYGQNNWGYCNICQKSIPLSKEVKQEHILLKLKQQLETDLRDTNISGNIQANIAIQRILHFIEDYEQLNK